MSTPFPEEDCDGAVDNMVGRGYLDQSNENPGPIAKRFANQARTFKSASAACKCLSGTATGKDTFEGSETAALEAWANRANTLISSDFSKFTLVSNQTSEHQVYFDGVAQRAIKCTWPGFYGQIPVAQGGKLERKNATPSEYLARMALHIEVFCSDIRFEGVTVVGGPSIIIGAPAGEPSIVISQEWISRSGTATIEKISQFLQKEGFESVPGSYFGWYRPTDGVVIVDAKPDNFIMTQAGIMPIDLQLAVFSPRELMQLGLKWLQCGLFYPDET